MTLDFTAYPNADVATKMRTEKFFELIKNQRTKDTALLKLIQQGICIEAEKQTKANSWAWTTDRALTWAADMGRTKVVQALVAAGANIEAQNSTGGAALMCAASKGHTETVQALLAAGANIEAQNRDRATPLINAAALCHAKTVQALLAAGANIEVQDIKGETALTLAGDGKIKKILNPAKNYESYDRFIANASPPKSPAELYALLTVTPAVVTSDPADFLGNIRKIFAHAHWPEKSQAAHIITQMQRDGRINAEAADSIMNNTFHERSHVARLQRQNFGMAL